MKYFSFLGRATRSEFWGVYAICFLIAMYASTAGNILPSIDSAVLATWFLLTLILILLSTVWACLAVTAQRCRDAGVSVWWTLVTVLPYLGLISVIVLGCLPTKNCPDEP